jgi:thiosulfate dehydrogenase [quinone] large subunit
MKGGRAASSGDFLGVGEVSAGYALFRVALGFDMLLHGVARFVMGLPKFVEGMVGAFQAAILPSWTVRVFATVLPFIALAMGVLLVIGLATRWASVAGVALMCALIFGTALQGKWDVVTQQLFYAAAFSGLLAAAKWNRFAVDSRRR